MNTSDKITWQLDNWLTGLQLTWSIQGQQNPPTLTIFGQQFQSWAQRQQDRYLWTLTILQSTQIRTLFLLDHLVYENLQPQVSAWLLQKVLELKSLVIKLQALP